jgi:enterochelin esterase-like enzyme
MKFHKRIAVTSLVVFLFSLCGCGGGSDSATTVEGRGHLERITISSNTIHKSMWANVYLPEGYAGGSGYPVLYIIHGMGANPDSWMPELGMNVVADTLIREGKIEPLIIVAPQMDESYGLGGYEGYLCVDLIQYIDSHYKSNTSREKRYIGGLSMGGFIALRYAFLHSDLFSKVGGHSAALEGYPGITKDEDNPIFIAKNMDLSSLKVYLDCGSSDPLYVSTAVLFDLLQSKGVTSENHLYSGDHTGIYWKSHMREYLVFYAGK